MPHEGHHPTHTYAGGSPATDGERLYVSFGSRGIYCFSLAGQLLWKTNLGEMRTRYGWGDAVTPVIHRDSLVVNWDQEEGSFITCLDASTGEAKWKTKRSGEVTSWNTPLVTSVAGRDVVIANGTNKVRAYDLADGKELWSCGGQTVNAIPSPVRFGDSVIAMSGYRGSLAVSIPPGFPRRYNQGRFSSRVVAERHSICPVATAAQRAPVLHRCQSRHSFGAGRSCGTTNCRASPPDGTQKHLCVAHGCEWTLLFRRTRRHLRCAEGQHNFRSRRRKSDQRSD